MKRILQRKFMLVFWLAMLTNCLLLKAEIVDIKFNGFPSEIGYVEIIPDLDPNSSSANVTVKVKRGFDMSYFYSSSLDNITNESLTEIQGEYKCTRPIAVYDYDSAVKGNYDAQFQTSELKTPVELANVLNYFYQREDQQPAATYTDNEVTVTEARSKTNRPIRQMDIKLSPQQPFTIHISGWTKEPSNDAGVLGFLTIKGDVTIDGEYYKEGERQIYPHLARKTKILGGNVLLKEVSLSHSFKSAVIIEDGTVTFDHIGYEGSFNSSIEENTEGIKGAIQQNGGTVMLKDCFVSSWGIGGVEDKTDYFISVTDGTLTIEGGYYPQTGLYNKDLIHVAGENTKVYLKNVAATLDAYDRTAYFINQEAGEVTIDGGEYEAIFCLNGGQMTVKGGRFSGQLGTPKDNIGGSFHIMSADAHLSLEGGYYGCGFNSCVVYAKPELNITPESLLADGYGYYTRNQAIVPDRAIQEDDIWGNYGFNGITNKYLSFGQVKKIGNAREEAPALYIAAEEASVGNSGTDLDVKVGGSEDEPIYEVYTPKGLAWVNGIYNLRGRYGKSYMTNGMEFAKKYSKASVKIVNDLDMSAYPWIPLNFNGKNFDGQGHRIYGLDIKASEAAFFGGLSSNVEQISNLTISGSIKGIESIYRNRNLYVGGLATTIYNTTIVNCGVQLTDVGCDVSNIANIAVGGLIAVNTQGSIQNCYITNNNEGIYLKASYDNERFSYIEEDLRIAGLIGSNSGEIVNSYQANGALKKSAENKISTATPLKVKWMEDPLANETPTPADATCTTNPNVDELNKNVKDHNTTSSDIQWRNWLTESNINAGYPIHDYSDDPTVSDGWIYLKKSGEGNFEAKYKILVSENEQQDCIIKADTSVKVNIPKEMVFKITPADGYNFEKLTFAPTNSEAESIIEIEKDTVKIEAMAGTYTAYFIPIPVEPTDTIVIDNDSTLIPEEVKDQDLVINGGREDEYISLTMSEITVQSLTVEGSSHAIFTVSGTNNWGSVINDGTMIIQAEGENSKIVTSSIINNGVFKDETGTITKVTGMASLTINPMVNQTVDEGETVILTAKAEASEEVSFTWQKYVGNTWKDVESTPNLQTRALLRNSSTQTSHLVVSSEEAGQYRCIITCINGTVSTTLTTFATVTVNTDTEEPEDPETPPVDPVKYYNIYEESICDGVSVSFSKNPVKEGGSISIKVEKDEENYTFENFKVWYKEGYYGNWEELKESTQPGEYKIQNIWNHIYVKAEGSAKKNPTGIEEVEGVKVYTKDGSLFVQTLQREQVIVISMTGAVVKNEEQIGLKQYHGLNPGIYVVRVGDKTYKLRLH